MKKTERSNRYFAKRLALGLTKEKNEKGFPLDFQPSKMFLKDIKKFLSQDKNLHSIYTVINKLRYGDSLDDKNVDHALKNIKRDIRDCHPDFNDQDIVLIYKISQSKVIGIRVGSHSEIFTENSTKRLTRFKESLINDKVFIVIIRNNNVKQYEYNLTI